MDDKKKSFVVFCDTEEALADFTDAQVGAVFRGLFAYEKRGERYSENDPAVKAALGFLYSTMDRNREKYNKIREKRREAGAKGGQKTAQSKCKQMLANASKSQQTKQMLANASKCKQNAANQAVSVSDSVSDSVSVSDIYNPPTPLTGGIPPEGGCVQKRRRPTFKPPTLDEVRAYCSERGKGVDPEQWFDHYASNGWKVGKNAMKDWKAAVRTWERSEYRSTQAAKKRSTGPSPLSQPTPEQQAAADRALEQNQAELSALLASVGFETPPDAQKQG